MKIQKITVEPNSKYQTFYHGSNKKITTFDFSNIKSDNTNQNGPGIYFTSSLDDARIYGKYLHKVQLKIVKSRLIPDKKRFAKYLVQTLIQKSPDLEEILLDWAENPKIALKQAIDTIYDSYSPNDYKRVMDSIWWDFYKGKEAIWLKELCSLGWDGYLVTITKEANHFICYNTDVIKNIELL